MICCITPKGVWIEPANSFWLEFFRQSKWQFIVTATMGM